MIRRLALLTVFAVFLGSTPGCAYFRSTPKLVSQSADKQIDTDLPVPLGFELDRKQSFKHQRNGFRRFHLVYRQLDYLGADRLVQFLKNAYTAAGWTTSFVYGLETTKILFTKGSEECRVEVMEDFGDATTEFKIELEARRTPNGSLVGRDTFKKNDFSKTVVSPTTVKASSRK